MTNLFKTTSLILATLVFGVVVSGCVKKPVPQPNVNQLVNQNVNVNQNANTATSTANIDTTNWKTYRNEQYGFEFKYPGEWVLNYNSASNIRLVSPEHKSWAEYPGDILVSITPFVGNVSVTEFHRSLKQYIFPDSLYQSLTIGSHDVYVLRKIPDTRWPSVYIFKLNNFFVEITASNNSIVEGIVQTFK